MSHLSQHGEESVGSEGGWFLQPPDLSPFAQPADMHRPSKWRLKDYFLKKSSHGSVHLVFTECLALFQARPPSGQVAGTEFERSSLMPVHMLAPTNAASSQPSGGLGWPESHLSVLFKGQTRVLGPSP